MKNKRKFQIGSLRCRHHKSASLSDNQMPAKLSLANLFGIAKKAFRMLITFKWINLLTAMKLILEIAEKIRNLILCKKPSILYRYGGI
jgi:hypothetical protein